MENKKQLVIAIFVSVAVSALATGSLLYFLQSSKEKASQKRITELQNELYALKLRAMGLEEQEEKIPTDVQEAYVSQTQNYNNNTPTISIEETKRAQEETKQNNCKKTRGVWKTDDTFCWREKEFCDNMGMSSTCSSYSQTTGCDCQNGYCVNQGGFCMPESYINQYKTCDFWFAKWGKWNLDKNECDCDENIATQTEDGGCVPKDPATLKKACLETGGEWDKSNYTCKCNYKIWSRSGKGCESKEGMAWKPVIYLYPEKKQKTSVKLSYAGKLTVTYPELGNGWNVLAYPDGKLIDLLDNKEYSYLFWEGVDDAGVNYNLSEGFVVEGNQTEEFLQTKLKEAGLEPKEYNEFIVYWLPKMLHNKYNLIHFASKEEYDDRAVLDINPKPDSVLRIFMVFKAFDQKVSVEPQIIKSFERKGFTVVEWGGTEIK